MAAHARGVQAAGLVPLLADGFQDMEALLNPVAPGIQGGLRLRHRRVGQQHPRLRLSVGLQHHQSAVRRRVTENQPSAHLQAARSRDQRAHGNAPLGLALRPKGVVGLVAQAGMPA